MRALAALAVLHVILAYPDGECDDVGMLQSSFSHAKEAAAIQISAMIHGGKHKGEPEAQHSAESASAKEKPAEEKSPQQAEEKPSQLAEEKPAEKKSPQPTEEKPSQLAEEKPAEEKSPQPTEEKPAEEKSPQPTEEKPAEEKSPEPTEEKPSQLAEEKPAEEKSPQSAEEKTAEEKSPQSAEEKPAEEKSTQPTEEKPSQLAEEKPAEEKSPQPTEEKPAEEKSPQPTEEKPAEEKSPEPTEEKPSQLAEEKPAEEKSPQPTEEKPSQLAEEKPAEEKSSQLAEEEPAEEKSPQPTEEKPSQLAEEKPAEEKSSQLAEEEPAEEKSQQSAEEKPAEEKSSQLAEEEPAEEKSPQPTEEKPSQLAEEKPAEEKSPQPTEEKPAEEKSSKSAEEKSAEEKSPQPTEEKPSQLAEEKPAEEKSPKSAEEKPAEEKSPQSAEEKEAAEMQKKFKPLKEIAMVLAKTKYHCKVLGDQRCLPMLKEYRRKAWPFLQKELGKNLTMFRPKGPQGMRNRWRPFFVKTRLQGCMEHPVVYMQVNGVKAKTLAMNLRKHSRPGAIKTGHIEKKEICRATKNKKTVGVTFVREPLARFTSAYGELMAARRRQPNMANGSNAALLEEDEKSSTEHARLFVENFLQGGGKEVTAAILPQAEYFAERSHNCSARMSFIGKSESPAQEWRRMIHDMDCDPTKIPYLNGTRARAAKANKTSLSLLQLSNGATSSMQKALKLDGGAYLRAWCWFSMPDYVLLDYDLPTACLETDMGMIIDWAWTWKVVPPPKKNTTTDAEHEDTEHEDKEFETI